jgi:hypothetical protein
VLIFPDGALKRTLAAIVPVAVVHGPTSPSTAELSLEGTESGSSHADIDPTPMPHSAMDPKTQGYFPAHAGSGSAALSIESQAIDCLKRAFEDPAIRRMSISRFLSTRQSLGPVKQVHAHTQMQAQSPSSIPIEATPEQPLSLASSAHSSIFSASGQGIMPTVAKAQGGGEWEASLSRRVARRRDGRRKMRKSSKEFDKKDGCGESLFPASRGTRGGKHDRGRSSSSTAGFGFKEMLHDLVAPVNKALGAVLGGSSSGMTGWKWSLAVVAVAAVGWGCWNIKVAGKMPAVKVDVVMRFKGF